MKALSLTNAQLKARSKPNLNAQLAEALRAAGYTVLTYAAWLEVTDRMRTAPIFVAEFPFAPTRPTWDYRKTTASPFEKARWQFVQVSEKRRWRWDFFAPILGLAVEIDGGSFTHGAAGGHSRGSQGSKDFCKRNEAAIDGLCVLKLDVNSIRKPEIALDFIQRAVASRQNQLPG